MDLEIRSPRPLYLRNDKPTLSKINIEKLKELDEIYKYPDFNNRINSIIKTFNSSITLETMNRLYKLIEEEFNNKELS